MAQQGEAHTMGIGAMLARHLKGLVDAESCHANGSLSHRYLASFAVILQGLVEELCIALLLGSHRTSARPVLVAAAAAFIISDCWLSVCTHVISQHATYTYGAATVAWYAAQPLQ